MSVGKDGALGPLTMTRGHAVLGASDTVGKLGITARGQRAGAAGMMGHPMGVDVRLGRETQTDKMKPRETETSSPDDMRYHCLPSHVYLRNR